MKKMSKVLVLAICIILTVMLCTGCSTTANFASGSRKIYVNLSKKYASFSNVDFYDFVSGRKISSFIGNVSFDSSAYGSTELFILTSEDVLYCIKTDTVLNKMPSSFKLYTNSGMTTYNTYVKK